MDWRHFQDEKTGQFKLRRLPTITGPVKVYDRTDLTGLHSEYRGLDWEKAKRCYAIDFSDEYCYEPEVEDMYAAIQRGSKEVLGPLHLFKKCIDDLFQLFEEYRQAPSKNEIEPISLDPAVAKKALKEELVRPVVPATTEEWSRHLSRFKVPELKKMLEEHGLATSGRKAELIDRLAHRALEYFGAVDVELDYVATPELEKALVSLIERLLLHLESSLTAYPEAYQKAVWENLILDWDHQDLVMAAGENLNLPLLTQAEARQKHQREGHKTSSSVLDPSDYRGSGDFAISISVSSTDSLEVGSPEGSRRHMPGEAVEVDVAFDYQGASDAAPRQRTITTTRVQQKDGEIYLKGFCHDSSFDVEKSFRLDRVVDVIANIQTGEMFKVKEIRGTSDLVDHLRRWDSSPAEIPLSSQVMKNDDDYATKHAPGVSSDGKFAGYPKWEWIIAVIIFFALLIFLFR
ncbi:SAP domain-containing protein [Halomonas sp.]|uniref:SAP domain-containing protein n=1 Tax=Halomonas sp. TaxID=1486246 RepID=UPI003D0D6A2D